MQIQWNHCEFILYFNTLNCYFENSNADFNKGNLKTFFLNKLKWQFRREICNVRFKDTYSTKFSDYWYVPTPRVDSLITFINNIKQVKTLRSRAHWQPQNLSNSIYPTTSSTTQIFILLLSLCGQWTRDAPKFFKIDSILHSTTIVL